MSLSFGSSQFARGQNSLRRLQLGGSAGSTHVVLVVFARAVSVLELVVTLYNREHSLRTTSSEIILYSNLGASLQEVIVNSSSV